MRKFETGATRDTDQDKFDYEGFINPIVMYRYAQYMHKHRKQADGQLRDSDNWQKGIPITVYMKSLLRHVMDLWFHHRKRSGYAREGIQETLCAIIFNAMGYLFELMKDDLNTPVMQKQLEDISVINYKQMQTLRKAKFNKNGKKRKK
jgi:hypothetical protein